MLEIIQSILRLCGIKSKEEIDKEFENLDFDLVPKIVITESKDGSANIRVPQNQFHPLNDEFKSLYKAKKAVIEYAYYKKKREPKTIIEVGNFNNKSEAPKTPFCKPPKKE